MKLDKKEEFEDIVIGAESEEAFSIEGDSRVIFDILRDKMYSDKIGAVCREVSSNARDANREAGKGHVPIDIVIYDMEEDKENELFLEGVISDTSISFEDKGP